MLLIVKFYISMTMLLIDKAYFFKLVLKLNLMEMIGEISKKNKQVRQ